MDAFKNPKNRVINAKSIKDFLAVESFGEKTANKGIPLIVGRYGPKSAAEDTVTQAEPSAKRKRLDEG